MSGRFAENVIPDLVRWRAEGRKTALLTLYDVEPTGPRPAGSQMAVAGTGAFVGFLSGGCVEGALVEEAQAAMAEGKNRQIRYGVNSPYFDIALPCGSAIDVHIDVGLADAHAQAILTAQSNRTPVRLVSDMTTGGNDIHTAEDSRARPQLLLDGGSFDRLYRPAPKLVVAGKGPVVIAAAEIASAAGLEVLAVTTEDDTAAAAKSFGARTRKVLDPAELDAWTAVATLFHEHDLENPVLAAAMESDAFYIGALGSRKTQSERLARLADEGWTDNQCGRIHG
ncbi:MAG: XdhC family protein, partial [Proteobacteria bacterium]|nr:XdhC family protein [Pseudomonadota bacterium]